MITIKADDFNWQGRAMLVVCANGKYFGSGLGIAPQAQTADGLLSVTIVGDVSLFEYLRCLPQLKACTPISHREVLYCKAAEVRLSGNGSMETDGEPGKRAECVVAIGGNITVLA